MSFKGAPYSTSWSVGRAGQLRWLGPYKFLHVTRSNCRQTTSQTIAVAVKMKYGLSSILILGSAIGALASPTQNVLSLSKPRPLVIWHGLGASALFKFPAILVAGARVDEPPSTTGDSYNSSGILEFQSAIEEMHRGIYIHSVYVDPDSKKDLQATFVRSECCSHLWLLLVDT